MKTLKSLYTPSIRVILTFSLSMYIGKTTEKHDSIFIEVLAIGCLWFNMVAQIKDIALINQLNKEESK